MAGCSQRNFYCSRSGNQVAIDVLSRHNTVYRRYAFGLGTSAALGIGFAAAAFALQSYRDARSHIEMVHSLQTQSAKDRTATALAEIERNLRAIAAVPWSATGLTQDDRVLEYRRALSTLPLLQEISLVSPEGQVLVSVSRNRPVALNSTAIFDAAYIVKARTGEPTYSDVGVEQGRTTPFVYVALSDKGSSSQISVAKVGLQTLSDELGKLVTNPQSAAYIVDEKGFLVAHSNKLVSLRLDALKTDASVQSAIRQAEAGEIAGNLLGVREGNDVFVSWQSLRNPRWLFFVDDQKSEVFAPVYRSLSWSAGLLGVGLAGALAASFWLARRMTRPIIALSKSAGEFAKGNLDHRIPEAQIAEFQIVAQGFNQMAAELKVLTTDLENKVREKTSQLETEFVTREAQGKEIVKLEERARIMRDFHDGVGGHLVSLLGAAKRDALDAKQIEAMVSDALVDFRIAIDSLSPEETDMTTALAGLRFRLLSRVQAAGLESAWSLAELPERLDFSREVIFHVQRIVAEAITNVIKHAQASRVDVSARVEASSAALVIDVIDDGIGFSHDASAGEVRRGRGVANILQRTGLVGGEVVWLNGGAAGVGAARGTVMRLRLPVVAGVASQIGARHPLGVGQG